MCPVLQVINLVEYPDDLLALLEVEWQVHVKPHFALG
jgi:hypothetical protein